jgi:hypothetical protein
MIASAQPDSRPASQIPGLPVVGILPEKLWQQIAEGQPVLLIHDGEPAAVVVDYESWQEVETLAGGQ